MRRHFHPLLSAGLLAGLSPLLSACGGGSAESATLGAAQGQSVFDKPYRAKNASDVDAAAFLGLLGLSPAQYGEARFDPQLGAVVVQNLSFSAGEGRASAARAEFYGPDRAALGAIMAGGEGEDLLSPFKRVRLYGVTFKAVQEASEASEDAEAEGAPLATADAEAGAEAGAELGAEKGGADGDDAVTAFDATIDGVELIGPRLAPGFLGDDEGNGLDRFAFDGATFHGARFEGAQEGSGFDLFAARLDLEGYSAGRIGPVTARDGGYGGLGNEAAMAELAEGSPQLGALLDSPFSAFLFPSATRTTFERLEWEGADLAGLLRVLRRGDAPSQDAEGLLSIGGLTIDDSVSFVEGREVSRTGKITVSDIPFIGLMPRRFVMEAKDSVTDYTAYLGDDRSALRDVLEERGLGKVEGRYLVDYRYDPEAGDVALSNTMNAKGFFDSTLAVELGGFDHAALAAGDEAAMGRVAVKGLSLVLDDDSLLDTAFAVGAVGGGQDAAMLRQQAVGIVTLAALQGSQISPRIPEFAAALSTFLSEGGTLSVALEPETPVTIGALETSDPAALIERLNLTVERTD